MIHAQAEENKYLLLYGFLSCGKPGLPVVCILVPQLLLEIKQKWEEKLTYIGVKS